MAKVKQEFTGDAAKLLAEYAKMREAMLKLEQGQQKIVDQSKKQAREMLSMQQLGIKATNTFRTSVTGLITQYASATVALQALNAETERKNRLAREAMQANITVGDAQAGVIKNIGDVSDEDTRKFLDNVANVQREVGFQSQAPLLQAAASILSATAGDQNKTLEILKAAAPFFKDQQAELARFGGAVGDVMGVTGDPNANRALGLMLAIQGQARFEDLAAFKHVAPALASAGVTQPGVDKTQATREVAALFAAIGGRAGDVDGQLTKTAVANLATNLQKAFPKEGLSIIDRLKQGWADPEAQAEILKGGFEGAVRPIITELVTNPNSQTTQAALAALEKIVGSEEFVTKKRAQLEGLTDELGVAGRSRESAGNVEAYQTGVGASIAEARSVLEATLDQAGLSGIDNWLKLKRFDWAGEGNEIRLAKQMLLEVQDQIMYGGILHLGMKDPRNLNPVEQEQLELIGRQLRVLQDIERNSRRQPPPSPTVHQEAR